MFHAAKISIFSYLHYFLTKKDENYNGNVNENVNFFCVKSENNLVTGNIF